jgi:hypothetical protein
MTRRGLSWFLSEYLKWQDEILLCYRDSEESSWADRCMFLGENYNPNKAYNHRSIIANEVVIEFDEKDASKNKALAEAVCSKLDKDNIVYSSWISGNKSVHVHVFFDFKEAKHQATLKRAIMNHYTDGIGEPDFRLCADNHLIRAEYGVHERTGKQKSPIYCAREYPKLNRIAPAIWDRYNAVMASRVKRELSGQVTDLSQYTGYKYVLTAHEFRATDDGRERAMFMLIHTCKRNYKTKEELFTFIWDWYRYCSGYKMSERDVWHKVTYHWDKEYTITTQYLNDLLRSIGREDLVGKKEV